MVDRAELLISEIKQIKAQYVREVGRGRRAWPKSIKERVAELDSMGVAAKSVAERSGISYETVIFWRHRRRKAGQEFHALSVSPSGASLPVTKEIANAGTVTVPTFAKAAEGGGVPLGPLKLRVPGGFVVEGLCESSVVSLLGRLTSGGFHAS